MIQLFSLQKLNIEKIDDLHITPCLSGTKEKVKQKEKLTCNEEVLLKKSFQPERLLKINHHVYF